MKLLSRSAVLRVRPFEPHSYKTTTFGLKALAAGVHKIRLTATSKNSSSSNYYVSADSFILQKQ